MSDSTPGRSRPQPPLEHRLDPLVRALPAFAGCLAIAAFAALGAPGDGRVEGLYLARLAFGPLVCAAWLAPSAGYGGLAAVLTATAAWVLPPGPPRAATVTGSLAVALAVAGLAHWSRLRTRGARLPSATALAAFALGAQMLLRGDLILGAPTLRSSGALVALPVVGALAIARLGERYGERALVALAALLALGPGWNVATTAAAVALAAAEVLADRFAGRGTSAAAALAALLLLAPLAWNPRLAALAALGGALVVADRFPRPWIVRLVVLVGGGSLLAATAGGSFAAPSSSAPLAWLLLLVPSAVIAGALGNAAALASLAFAIVAAVSGAGLPGLAAPVALGALAVAGRLAERERIVRAWQLAWSAGLLLATFLLASYPWLRSRPAASALAALGLDVDASLATPALWLPALAIAIAALLAGWAVAPAGAVPARQPGRLAGRIGGALAAIAGGALGLALLLHAGRGARALLEGEVALSASAAPTRLEVPASEHGTALTVESALLDSADLPAGTAVADIRIDCRDGSTRAFVLRAGSDTGEWAAGRPDLRTAGLAAPAPWLSWVAVGTPPFFGQRYRTRFEVRPKMQSTSPIAAVTVTRAAGLPPRSTLVLYDVLVAD